MYTLSWILGASTECSPHNCLSLVSQIWMNERGKQQQQFDVLQNGLGIRFTRSTMIIVLLLTSPIGQSCQVWLNGLVVWFLLRVQEVPGSNPGWAQTFFYFRLIIIHHKKIMFQIKGLKREQSNSWHADMRTCVAMQHMAKKTTF